MAGAVKDSQVSLRLPGELKQQMETYAQMTGRSVSHVAMEALAEYLVTRIPQVDDLKAAVAAADHGEFAAADEVDAVFGKYTGTKPVAAVARRATKKAVKRPRRA